MTGIRLRPATLADLDFVLTAEQHPENAPFVGSWTREHHESILTDDDWAHFIIDVEGRDAGYLMLSGLNSPDEVIGLHRLAVTEKGRGIGRATLRLVKELAFGEHAAHRLWLDVQTQNARAIHLYESEGFVREGTLREVERSGTGFDSLHLYAMLEDEYRRLISERA